MDSTHRARVFRYRAGTGARSPTAERCTPWSGNETSRNVVTLKRGWTHRVSTRFRRRPGPELGRLTESKVRRRMLSYVAALVTPRRSSGGFRPAGKKAMGWITKGTHIGDATEEQVRERPGRWHWCCRYPGSRWVREPNCGVHVFRSRTRSTRDPGLRCRLWLCKSQQSSISAPSSPI